MYSGEEMLLYNRLSCVDKKAFHKGCQRDEDGAKTGGTCK